MHRCGLQNCHRAPTRLTNVGWRREGMDIVMDWRMYCPSSSLLTRCIIQPVGRVGKDLQIFKCCHEFRVDIWRSEWLLWPLSGGVIQRTIEAKAAEPIWMRRRDSKFFKGRKTEARVSPRRRWWKTNLAHGSQRPAYDDIHDRLRCVINGWRHGRLDSDIARLRRKYIGCTKQTILRRLRFSIRTTATRSKSERR